MIEKLSVPSAPSLIESMRSLGYSFKSAMADLLDNSVSADCKNIDIILKIEEQPYIAILDDGHGMDSRELEEAMRYGSKNPLNHREEKDLGRFGLGLKSASLSQCRELIVISKNKGDIAAFSWNLDFVIKNMNWTLLMLESEEISKLPEISTLNNISSGTLIILKQFDRISYSTGSLVETLKDYMAEATDHIGLVFHRFINEGLKITVNGVEVPKRDPFLKDHIGTQHLREQKININDSAVLINPYILPHQNKLNKDDIKLVGSIEELKKEQGFYIYRNRRLIIWGTWFRIGVKNELTKLARVMVDIPSDLDYMWNIDVKKSSATLPDIIKKRLYSSLMETMFKSEKVQEYRGRRESNKDNLNFVWDRIVTREGHRYSINRSIPQISLLESTLSKEQLSILESLLEQIENAFPIQSVYIDTAKGTTMLQNSLNEEELLSEIIENLDFAYQQKMDVDEMMNLFLSTEPYCNYESLKNKVLNLVEEKYERSENII